MNRAEELGINLIHLLAKYNKITGIDGISKELDCSTMFLHQISRKLRKSGYIKTHRGPGGGVSINQVPTLLDVKRCLGKPYKPLAGRAGELQKIAHDFYDDVYVVNA